MTDSNSKPPTRARKRINKKAPAAPPDLTIDDKVPLESTPDATPAGPESFDPFDPASLRIDPSLVAEQIGVEKAVLVCPVRKPDRQEFVRVHRDPAFKIDIPILEDKESREVFLVDKSIAPSLPDFIKVVRLCLAINRHDSPFLWMARLTTTDRKDNWSISMLKAQDLAVDHWVRVQSNMASGHYEVHKATGSLPAPSWPENKSLRDYLELAFGGSRIDSANHPVVQRLYGAT